MLNLTTYALKKFFLPIVLFFLTSSLFASDIVLHNSWFIRKSSELTETPEVLSRTLPDTKNWYKTTVPSTVLNALIKNGQHQDIFYSNNLDKVSAKPFEEPWYYLTSFSCKSDRYYTLIFDGINYSADIWLNGKKIASADTLAGTFNTFKIALSSPQASNTLLVKIYPPKPGDLTIGFVDWSPEAPDRNMGLWRPVRLHESSAVSIEQLLMYPVLEVEKDTVGRLSFSVRLQNHTNAEKKLKLKIYLNNKTYTWPLVLPASSITNHTFDHTKIKALWFDHPKLWWPNGMGDAYLYKLKVEVIDKTVSDYVSEHFAFRRVTSRLSDKGHRFFSINGKDIQLHGGGWVDDLFLNEDSVRLKAKVDYITHLNHNCVRFEGIWGNSEYVYDLLDQQGILLLAGFSCQWEWPHYLGKEFDAHNKYGGIITPEEMDIAASYVNDALLWLNHHPSFIVWIGGSDKSPEPSLEQRYLDLIEKYTPRVVYISSATEDSSVVTGRTGVKMRGPYEYVTPNYWSEDTIKGGAWGFNTEVGPGPQIPLKESLLKMIPQDSLWPAGNSSWRFHSGRRSFENIDIFNNALTQRYGKSESFDDYLWKVQIMNYEAMRPAFEAQRVNYKIAGGQIHWMLNACWPKMHWQLYDYYMLPNAAFYANRKACAPLSVIYNYADTTIYIVDDNMQNKSGWTVTCKLYSPDSKIIMDTSYWFSTKAKKIYSNRETILTIPKKYLLQGFLSLQLRNASGEVVADNFYWLSDKKDVLDYENSGWYYTYNKSFADLHYISGLPEAEINYEIIDRGLQNGKRIVEIEIYNVSKVISFFNEFHLYDEKGEIIKPEFWSDNFISLIPGEKRIVRVYTSYEGKFNFEISSKNSRYRMITVIRNEKIDKE